VTIAIPGLFPVPAGGAARAVGHVDMRFRQPRPNVKHGGIKHHDNHMVGHTPPAGLGRVALPGRSEVSGTWVKNGVASAATKLVFGHNHGLRDTMATGHDMVNWVDLGPWRPPTALPTQ
jgi:hypothetical protein